MLKMIDTDFVRPSSSRPFGRPCVDKLSRETSTVGFLLSLFRPTLMEIQLASIPMYVSPHGTVMILLIRHGY